MLLPLSAVAAAPGLQEDRLLAQFVPTRFATLSAELPARVESIGFREGEAFRKGAVLFSLDCASQRAQRERALAELAGARAAHEGNLELAGLGAVGAVELAATEAQLAAAAADTKYLHVTLGKCEVLAPWDGIAGEWFVRPLEYVQPGQAVIAIHDPVALQVEFIAPTAWLSWIDRQTKLEIVVEELGRTVPLVLRATSARADPVSQSVKAIADPISLPQDIIAGMTGVIRVLNPPERSALKRGKEQ
ncbi:membrane-fusion protein [gamma proteobacterium NOR5-3]|nr:membrane-fusion protein [gamma proteobacterium NOR5-3]